MVTGYLHYSTTVRQCKGGGATFNRVNTCTNQNKTLMKQIQNSQKPDSKQQKPIEKSIPVYGF
jgi:hypothetical protein